jgi:hypothetical protein
MAKKMTKVTKTITMRKEDAAKWLKALRSGKYEQTTGTLCEKDDIYENPGYCCLGVMQDVLGKVQEGKELPTLRWLQDHKIKISFPECGDFTPDGRNSAVDIPLVPPVVIGHSRYDTVSSLNDESDMNFKEIAAILDKRIKRV